MTLQKKTLLAFLLFFLVSLFCSYFLKCIFLHRKATQKEISPVAAISDSVNVSSTPFSVENFLHHNSNESFSFVPGTPLVLKNLTPPAVNLQV